MDESKLLTDARKGGKGREESIRGAESVADGLEKALIAGEVETLKVATMRCGTGAVSRWCVVCLSVRLSVCFGGCCGGVGWGAMAGHGRVRVGCCAYAQAAVLSAGTAMSAPGCIEPDAGGLFPDSGAQSDGSLRQRFKRPRRSFAAHVRGPLSAGISVSASMRARFQS